MRWLVKASKRLFGSWDMEWIAYNFAHDIPLPGMFVRRYTPVFDVHGGENWWS